MMATVIEVRFYNTDTQEMLHQSFTLVKSNEEALRVALDEWSAGSGTIKEIKQVYGPKFVNGVAPAWRYDYECVVEEDFVVYAVLFTNRKEGKKQE